METLNTADERKISSFVRELYHLDKIESFSQRVVEGLGRIIRRKQRWHPFSETEIREVHVTEDAASEIKKLCSLWSRRSRNCGSLLDGQGQN
jgi:hypothetical protein